MTKSGNKRQIMVGHANTIHDPAICILEGDNVFAESFERHMQCKRAWDGGLYYSARPISQALTDCNLWPVSNAEVQVLTTWDTQDLKSWKTPDTISLLPVRAQSERIGTTWRFEQLLKSILTEGHPSMAAPLSPRPDIRVTSKTLSHHLSHAATCALTSPFEDCVVMVLDGFAEDRCSAFFHFHDNRFDPIETGPLKSLEREVVNRSFGTAYAVATSLCGFKPTEGEEWKVMGLAGYGLERPEIQDFFNAHTCVDGLIVEFSWMDRAALKDLEELVGGFREFGDPDTLSAADLARNFQTCWEDALIAVASALDEMKLSPNLAFGGGCALNSSANGKILNRTGFEQLHVPCAPADDGNALGAALYEAHCVRAIPRLAEVHSPYLGSRTPVAEIERIIAFGGIAYDRAEDYTALCAHVADILVRGGIIGWMQGSAEFGPRALGNRSILADPRSVEIKQRINKTVKFREDFRPIAPAILDERGPEYFEDYQPSPYMERTLKVRCEKQGDIPSVVHVDGTARLQSVRRAWNPLFHDLLVAFDALTDVPVLANTSLNVMGKPIVHSVQDALLVFFSSGLDHMVIDRYVLSK